MTNQLVLKVAEAVKIAADIREQSYISGSGKYKLDETQAAEQACKAVGLDPALGGLIGIALNGWWNDTIHWAETFGIK